MLKLPQWTGKSSTPEPLTLSDPLFWCQAWMNAGVLPREVMGIRPGPELSPRNLDMLLPASSLLASTATQRSRHLSKTTQQGVGFCWVFQKAARSCSGSQGPSIFPAIAWP